MKLKLLLLFVSHVLLAHGQSANELGRTLRLMSREHSAIIGYLGDPTMGLPAPGKHLTWLSAGFMISQGTETSSELRFWRDVDGAARFAGNLNLSGLWAVSPNSQLICSQPPQEDSPDGNVKQSGLGSSAIICHSFADKAVRWQWELDKARVLEVAFSPDSKQVALSVSLHQELHVILLNAATGEELNKVLVPDYRPYSSSVRGALVYHRDAIFYLCREEKGSSLIRLTVPELSFQEVPLEFLEDRSGSEMASSPDENWLVIHDRHDYAVFRRNGLLWKPSFQGEVTYEGDYNSMPSLTKAVFSPDNRHLFVSTNKDARVFSLNDGKVVKEFETGSTDATFSPAGDVLLIVSDGVFKRWDTTLWTEVKPADHSLHEGSIRQILFMDNGTRLLCRDSRGLVLWDMASRKAVAQLKTDRPQVALSGIVLVNGDKEVLIADSWDFIRWSLPPAGIPKAGPLTITGQPAFAGPRSQEMGNMNIVASPSGRQVVTFQKGMYMLRDSSPNGRVTPLTELNGNNYSQFGSYAFRSEDEIAILLPGALARYNVKTGQLKKVREEKYGLGVNSIHSLPKTKDVSVLVNSSRIQLWSEAESKLVKQILPPSVYILFEDSHYPLAFSPDESLMVAIGKNRLARYSLHLYDMASGNWLGWHALGDDRATCMSFSPDGRTLAVGHYNQTVSLWDVEKLRSMVKELPDVTKQPASKEPAKAPYVMLDKVPETSFTDKFGLEWQFKPDGSFAIDSSMPSFGVLKMGDESFKSESVRFWNREGTELGTNVSLMVEGKNGEGNIIVSRHLQTSPKFVPCREFVDAFTNVGTDPRELKIEFSFQFPAGTTCFWTPQGKVIQPGANGQVILKDDDSWLFPNEARQLEEPFPAVRVRSYSGQVMPDIRWDAATQTMTMKYRVTLAPFETRWTSYGVRIHQWVKGIPPSGTYDLEDGDFGHTAAWGENQRGINFGPLNHDLPKEAHYGLQVWGQNESFDLAKDPLGFAWDATHGGGRTGELGASQLYALWLDERPASFSLRSLFRGPHLSISKFKESHRSSFRSLDKSILVLRSDFSEAAHPVSLWQDTFRNTGTDNKTVKASYLHAFSRPVVEIVDDAGRIYQPGDLAALNSSDAQACALVTAGDMRPATLITFNRQGGKIRSTLRRVTDSVFFQDYELELAPESESALIHAACQRPLAAYTDAVDAFNDWLPLTQPKTDKTQNKSFPFVLGPVENVNGSFAK